MKKFFKNHPNLAKVSKIIGIFFVLLGIIGLFIPFVHGWFFILFGLVLLGEPRAVKVWKKLHKKMKKHKMPLSGFFEI